MNNATNLSITLTFVGDLHFINELTDLLAIQPTSSWSKNEVVAVSSNKNRIRKNTLWEYMVTKNSMILSDLSETLVDVFASKTDKIVKFTTERRISVFISICGEIFENKTPGLFFNKRLLSFAHSINAEIDCDLYIY